MRMTSKGQVTIPIAMRQKLGLLADVEVEFVLDLFDGFRGKATVGFGGVEFALDGFFASLQLIAVFLEIELYLGFATRDLLAAGRDTL